MELDLRKEGRNRTLHFFVNGKQQKHFFNNIPRTVEFIVCRPPIVYLPLSSFSIYKIMLLKQNEAVEFLSLRELDAPTTEHIEGEEAHPFWAVKSQSFDMLVILWDCKLILLYISIFRENIRREQCKRELWLK